MEIIQCLLSDDNGKEKQIKAKVSRRKLIIKIRTEINEIKNRKSIKPKPDSLKRSIKLINL